MSKERKIPNNDMRDRRILADAPWGSSESRFISDEKGSESAFDYLISGDPQK